MMWFNSCSQNLCNPNSSGGSYSYQISENRIGTLNDLVVMNRKTVKFKNCIIILESLVTPREPGLNQTHFITSSIDSLCSSDWIIDSIFKPNTWLLYALRTEDYRAGRDISIIRKLSEEYRRYDVENGVFYSCCSWSIADPFLVNAKNILDCNFDYVKAILLLVTMLQRIEDSNYEPGAESKPCSLTFKHVRDRAGAYYSGSIKTIYNDEQANYFPYGTGTLKYMNATGVTENNQFTLTGDWIVDSIQNGSVRVDNLNEVIVWYPSYSVGGSKNLEIEFVSSKLVCSIDFKNLVNNRFKQLLG